MITERQWTTAQVWGFPVLLMLLLLATELGGEGWRIALRYDREAIGDGQWWRLLTGNFVHLGWYHWMLNQIGIVVLVLLCPERLSPLVWLRRLLLIGIAMSCGLYFWVPQMSWYVGLSGVMHGLFLLGLGRQGLQGDRIALACLAYLFGKLAWEWQMGVPVSDEAAIGGKVALESHWFGALGALVYGLAFRSFLEEERWKPRWSKA